MCVHEYGCAPTAANEFLGVLRELRHAVRAHDVSHGWPVLSTTERRWHVYLSPVHMLSPIVTPTHSPARNHLKILAFSLIPPIPPIPPVVFLCVLS